MNEAEIITEHIKTFWRGKLSEILEEFKQAEIRGEYTVLFSKESLG